MTRFVWGEVVQVSPLLVRLDGRIEPVEGSPDCLVPGLAVGDRVYCVIDGRSLVVLGKAV